MPQSARSWGRLQPSLLEPREWTLWPHGGCGVGRQPRGPPRRQGPQAFQNDLICSAQEFDKMIVPARPTGEAARAKRKGAFHACPHTAGFTAGPG